MERLITKILVPVDGSPSSRKAIEMALALAGKSGGKITILEVIEEFGPLPGYYEAAPVGVNRVKWIEEQRFDKIHDVLESTSVAWDRRVLEGYPAEQICELAGKEKYDLIVIGSRGLSVLGRFLIGSVSDRVVHHAPCSVMVVK